MNQYLLRLARTHQVAQELKETQMACTNLPQKDLLYFEVYCLNVSSM
jgi:hypothetical protein